MKNTSYNKLISTDKKLLKEAERIMKKSYSPYSNFSVGAALLGDKNKIVSGANIENCAYGSTICAEASALVKARSEGIKKIERIAIIAKNNNKNIKLPVSPCGNCRQIILEFAKISKCDIEIIMSNTKMDKIIIAKISELLPLSFSDLNI